jgi:hypothetical protein
MYELGSDGVYLPGSRIPLAWLMNTTPGDHLG